MASLTVRGSRLYAKIKDVNGEWRRLRTPFVEGQREQAQKWADDLEAEAENIRERKDGAPGPLTIAVYARGWLKRRKNKTKKDDTTRMEKHVLPRIGHVLVTEARPRHFRDLIVALKDAGELAPKTIRHISGLVHSLFESAIIDELITENPVKYEKGVLPKKLDKDPTWRRQAIYTRPEVEQLISDDRIPIDRRVLYALKFFTGRHSEVSGLTWEQYDAEAKPLGSLAVDKTKTEVPRLIPVHPTLAKMLASWKLHDWEDLYGHKPRPVDLIVPTRKLSRRSANEAQRQLLYDLEKIGLRTKAGKERNRRGHDLRRTLISLARTAGAVDSVFKVITHGPSTQAILDLYSSFTWEQLCAEMAKLRVELREGQVIQMVANDPASGHGPGLVQSRRMGANGGLRASGERPRRDSNLRIMSGGDAPQQEDQDVTPARVIPSDTERGGLDHGVVQKITTTCDISLAMLRAAHEAI